MKRIWILAALALAGCRAQDQSPYAGPPDTFNQYYSRLKGKDKEIAGYGYTFGQTQKMMELDASYRNMQARSDPSTQSKLRKGIISLPTKKYTDENGVQHDSGYIQVETVQFVSERQSNGRTPYIVK